MLIVYAIEIHVDCGTGLLGQYTHSVTESTLRGGSLTLHLVRELAEPVVRVGAINIKRNLSSGQANYFSGILSDGRCPS